MDTFEDVLHDVDAKRGESNLSSVEITHGAKATTWKVKIYDENPEIAYNTARDIESKLTKEYGVKI